jgi:hypothetical protein
MSILSEGVFSSISFHGLGVFRFDRISYEHKVLLKSISKRDRQKFDRLGLVPKQLLQVFWDLGFLPGEVRPKEGMRIQKLLDFLQNGHYLDDRSCARGKYLRAKIMDEVSTTPDLPDHEIFLKCGRGKFVPLSHLRETPGTIWRR